MTYIICIPSYKRSNVCNEKTLTTLKEHNIPKKLINVFVANNTEYKEYEKILDKNLYNKLIVGKKGLVQQRQFIMNMYKDGEKIVFFDDDISKIDLSMSSKYKKHSLDYFFKSAFDECKKQNAYIWGVYPVFNPFFREGRPELSRDLRYIVGAFYGIINRPKLKPIQLTITKKNGQKEDVERTLRYFDHDRIVLRFDKIGFETKYYGKEGGLGTFEARLKPMEEATKKLLEKYPDYGSMIKKKTGMTEFKFKKIPAFTGGEKNNNNNNFREILQNNDGDDESLIPRTLVGETFTPVAPPLIDGIPLMQQPDDSRAISPYVPDNTWTPTQADRNNGLGGGRKRYGTKKKSINKKRKTKRRK